MNYVNIMFATLLILLSGCTNSDELPEDVNALRTLQKETRTRINELNGKLAKIEHKLTELDTSAAGTGGKLVTLDTVERSDFRHYISIQSTVASDNMVNVSAEISGRLLQLYAEEGDHIRSGQLIAKIDAESMRKQKEELKTALELAEEVYRRQKNLWDQEIGTEVQYLRAKNEKERFEKQIASLEYRLTKSKIYAPISGVVEQIHFESGELVSPGMPVLTVLDLDRMKVVADVPENYLGVVDKGDEVRLVFPALDTFRFEEVSRVGSTIHPTNRTFAVEVKTDNRNGMLKPNLTAQMKILNMSRDDAVVIPATLIQHEVSGKTYVFVVKYTAGGLQTVKRYVQTGPSYEGNIVVEQGLDSGDILIAEGARNVNDRERVRLK